MQPDRVTWGSNGDYQRRPHYMIALVAAQNLLPIEWAVSLLTVQFPPNVARSIWGMTHLSTDLARNLAVESALKMTPPADAILLNHAPALAHHLAWFRYAEQPRAVTTENYGTSIVPLERLRDVPSPWWEHDRPRGWDAEVVDWLTPAQEAIGLPQSYAPSAMPDEFPAWCTCSMRSTLG